MESVESSVYLRGGGGGGVPQRVSARLKSAVMLIHNPGKKSTPTQDWCIQDTAVWPVFLGVTVVPGCNWSQQS